MLLRADPFGQGQFGGSQAELEAILGYQEALRKLKKPTGGEKNGSRKGGGKGGKQKDSKKDTKGGKDGLE